MTLSRSKMAMIFPGLEVFISNFTTFPRLQDMYKPHILNSNQSKASSVQHSPVCISHTRMQKQSPTSHPTPLPKHTHVQYPCPQLSCSGRPSDILLALCFVWWGSVPDQWLWDFELLNDFLEETERKKEKKSSWYLTLSLWCLLHCHLENNQ